MRISELTEYTGAPTANAEFPANIGGFTYRIKIDDLAVSKFNSSVNSINYFQNNSLLATIIEGMSTVVPTAGVYKIDFNGQFNTTLSNKTQQTAVDLNNLYLELNALTVTSGTFPPFTNGTTITAGVYSIATAVGPLGNVTLNGGGNPNSIFVFRTDAAFTIGAGCVFILTNGAQAQNIYIIAKGAISLGANCNVSGNFISPLATVSIGASAFLNGRALSMAAAVATLGSISIPAFSGTFNMGLSADFAMFASIGAVSNVGANIIVGDVGSNNGTVTGFESATLSGNIYLPSQGASICQFAIYIDGVVIPYTIRERTNSITKEDVILTAVATITAGQTVTIKNTNSIGISRFYNRVLTISQV